MKEQGEASYMSGCGFWGLTTMLLMNRVASGSFTDTTLITTRPLKAFTFFMMGASIAAIVNAKRFKDQDYTGKDYRLKQRVA